MDNLVEGQELFLKDGSPTRGRKFYFLRYNKFNRHLLYLTVIYPDGKIEKELFCYPDERFETRIVSEPINYIQLEE